MTKLTNELTDSAHNNIDKLLVIKENTEHNNGVFSCCSIRLTEIIQYFNCNLTEPMLLDCSEQFKRFKFKSNKEDLTLTYFKDFNNFDTIPFFQNVSFHWVLCNSVYKKLNFNQLSPFVKKYFSVSNCVLKLVSDSEEKYNVDYDQTIAVCYRGNDKCTETHLARYDEFFLKAQEIITKSPNCRFFVQTDEQEFLDEFHKQFQNTFHLEELPLISKDSNKVMHDMLPRDQRRQFGCKILHSIYMQSKCKYVITHTGNCGLWTALFRGNVENFNQYLHQKRNVDYFKPHANKIPQLYKGWY